jgi:hypothetical protein
MNLFHTFAAHCIYIYAPQGASTKTLYPNIFRLHYQCSGKLYLAIMIYLHEPS